MAEAEDWQKQLINGSLYLRGRIIASYSQIEFLLAKRTAPLFEPSFRAHNLEITSEVPRWISKA
jgi:hypothetical protein